MSNSDGSANSTSNILQTTEGQMNNKENTDMQVAKVQSTEQDNGLKIDKTETDQSSTAIKISSNLTFSEIELQHNKKKDMMAQSQTKIFFENAVIKISIIGTWFAINIFLFFWSFFNFKSDPKFNYMFLMCKDYIFISRASALVINFNCAIVLLPMNRVFNSWVQNYIFKNANTTPRRVFDHMKSLHILSAFGIGIASVVHTIFHLINVFYFRQNYAEVVNDVNIADSKKNTTLWKFLLTIPGWTGAAMILILGILFVASLKAIRIKHNEVFRYIHQLSLLFLVLGTFHGFGNVTKFQTNVDDHPESCHNIDVIVDAPQCKARPQFKHVVSSSWKWIIGPLILHLIDRVIRFVRSLKTCALVESKIHNGNVIELVFYKNGFKSRPGQYVVIQCPEIAEWEWHPFTLTKCPTGKKYEEDRTFSVHIKVTGDWTSKLLELISSLSSNESDMRRVGSTCIVSLDETVIPTFRIDGPFGSPNQDGFHHRVNVSVAAGIGVTPYAAVLNFLKRFNPNKVHKDFKLERLHLIWVCKDVNEFSWVVDLIKEVRKHLIKIEREDILTVQLFVTQKYKVNIDSQAQQTENTFPQCEGCVTEEWFRDNMKEGRPDFKEVLTKIAVQYEREKIGLFYCGAKGLGKMLSDTCLKITQGGNTFIFRKESF